MHMCNCIAIEGWQLILTVFRIIYSKEGHGKGVFYHDRQLEPNLREGKLL